ncbi:MAG: kynureninase [Bacteroidales bacterium]
MNKDNLRDIAASLDEADPLRTYASFFPKSDSRLIYFDGNSLGMLPGPTTRHLQDVIERQWGQRLIRAYNEGWWMKPSDLGSRLAPLIGAGSDEVIVCDSVSVNMFKMLVAALRNSGDKKKVVSDELNFGTDLYIIQGVIDLLDRGHRLELMKSDDGITVSDGELEANIDDDTALVSLSYVSFRSSFMYDMDRVTELVHSKGACMLWDLCHAVGAVPINLNGANADFAVGCTYKYLNGGPGSTSFLYVRRDLQEKLFSPIWGWWADADPFSFNTKFRPSDGMRKYLAGSVPVLSSSTLESSLDIFEMAGMEDIRRKSVEMSTFFLTLVGEYLKPLGFSPGSPADPERRGSHVSLKHPEAFRICKALIDESEGEWTIIPDYRPPDNIRIGFAPLYNSFTEIAILTSELIRIVDERVYEKYDKEKGEVT